MLRKLLNKLTDSLDLWLSGLLLSTLAAFLLLSETQMRDWRFKARYLVDANQPISPNLFILEVSTKKANELTKVTPRFFLARLIDSVAQFQPRVMALDYEFLEDDRLDPHYADLQRAIKTAGYVILPCFLDLHANQYRLLSMPPENLVPAQQTGYATLESTDDMKLQARLSNKELWPSFALAAVSGYFFPSDYFSDQKDWPELQQKTLDSLKITSGESWLPINYAGPIEAEDTSLIIHDADKFLQRAYNREFWRPLIKDKIVLIGSTYRQPDGSDQFNTPYGTMFGVEVHANIINTLLTQNYLKPLGSGWALLFTTVSLAIAALSLLRLRLTAAAAATATCIFVYMLAGFWLFATKNLILPLAWPLKAGLFGFLFIYYLQRQGVVKRVREFLDFTILMEATEQPNHYQLRVIDSPSHAGEDSAEITLPEKNELDQALKRIQLGRVDENFLQDFGARLYQCLFPQKIAACYQRGLTQARLQKQGLRVRLRLVAPALQVLPWEYVYDPQNRCFLAAHREILLTRDVESDQPRRDMKTEALNALIVISNPDRNDARMLAYPELDVEYEKNLIVQALKELRDNTDIPIRYTILEHAVVDEIRQHLNQDFHIFHFIGHSTFREGVGKIILEDDEHVAYFADDAEFSKLFEGSTEMRLVIFNSCKSAVSAGLPAISGLTYRVIAAGVPAVVAMQYAIADDTATLFAREFYRTLAGGHPVDFAMTHARLVIAQKMKAIRPHDFGIPVLFMRARDGRIV